MLSPDQERTYTSRDDLRVFNLIQQPVWVFDIVKKAMWFANTAAVQLWSAESLDHLLARNFSEDMSEASARRLDDYLEKFRNGERLKDQWTFHPNGQPKTVDTVASGIHIEEGRMAMLVEGTYREISTPNEQQALRALEMIRHLPVAVCQFDMEGKVMEQNPEDRAAFGDSAKSPSYGECTQDIDASEFSHESTVTDVDEDDDEENDELMACQFLNRFVDRDLGKSILRNVKDGKDCSCEALLYTAHGLRWSSIRIRKAKDPISTEPVILFSARDISQVVDAKKYADKCEKAKLFFLAKMAHEARTPLSHIMTMIEHVAKSEVIKSTSSLNDLLRSSTNVLKMVMKDLTDTMGNVNSTLTLEPTRLNIEEVVEYTLSTLEPLAKSKNLLLHGSVADGLRDENVVGDPYRIRQVLYQILQNSIKFTDQGCITLSVKPQPQSRSKRIWMRFQVTDTGKGISSEDSKPLFQRNWTSGLSERNGLGLSICKELVDSMGGSIGVDGQAGIGTTIWFVLPFGTKTSSGINSPNTSKTRGCNTFAPGFDDNSTLPSARTDPVNSPNRSRRLYQCDSTVVSSSSTIPTI